VRLVRLAALVALLFVVPLRAGSTITPAVPRFDHVVVVVFENKSRDEVLGNPAAPYFNRLASRYTVLSRYGGVAHPSLPNYLALVSGSTQGITSDCTSCVVSARNLADTLEHAHLTWKGYAEGLPRPGFTGASAGRYAKKHMPFLYFRNIVRSRVRLHRVVPLTRFSRNLSAGTLPSFSLVVPDLCHDMHDCSVSTGDTWLRGFLKPLLRSPRFANSVAFVITDEPRFSSPPESAMPALAAGPLVKRGFGYAAVTSHYGLLRTIEDAWGLPRLGRSARTAPVRSIWR
jgi:hypothetical protein